MVCQLLFSKQVILPNFGFFSYVLTIVFLKQTDDLECISDGYSEPSQTSKIEPFAKILAVKYFRKKTPS